MSSDSVHIVTPSQGAPILPHDRHRRSLSAHRLAEFAPDQNTWEPERPLRSAAVCVALVPTVEAGSCFVLTKRASTLRRNAGQWALPGGRVEGGESMLSAALRELAEEVGLEARPNDVLGTLDPIRTRSGFEILPVVVWFRGEPVLRLNEAEVSEVYLVSIGELLRKDSPRFIDGVEGPTMQILLGEYTLHAPTAAILHQFGEVVLRGRATRVAEVVQPQFTSR